VTPGQPRTHDDGVDVLHVASRWDAREATARRLPRRQMPARTHDDPRSTRTEGRACAAGGACRAWCCHVVLEVRKGCPAGAATPAPAGPLRPYLRVRTCRGPTSRRTWAPWAGPGPW